MNSKATQTKTTEQKALLRSLPQSVVAEVFGVAPSWLRDNAHRVPRNDDGTYDASEVVKMVRSDFKTAELPEPLLERVLLLLDMLPIDALELSQPGAISILEQVDRDHGPAGLAAVTLLLLGRLRFYESTWGVPSVPAPTPEEIRKDNAAKAEAEIADLPRWDAWRDLRVVARCEQCGLRRRGSKWVDAPTPDDHEEKRTLCEGCCSK